MKALTKKQEAALNKIRAGLENKPAGGSYYAYQYWKDEWKRNGGHDGIPEPILLALEKKGHIKCDTHSGRKTGVFNPVADSWGYSTYWKEITVTLNEAQQ